MPILNVRAETRDEKGQVIPAPELLTGNGPVVPVAIALSDESQRAYSEQGKNPPGAITGFALVDTGASRTCFDEGAAQKAGLPVVDTATMASASHTDHRVQVFMGKIVLLQTNIVIDVEGGLGVNLSAFNGLIALIGRDLLKNTIFTYNGPDGLVSLSM